MLSTLLSLESHKTSQDLSSSTKGKSSVYLHLSRLDTVSTRFKKQMTSLVHRYYFAVEPSFVFTTRQLLLATEKHVLHALQHSNIIYHHLRHCDGRCVGRTCLRLSNRIKQNVPKSIRTGQFSKDQSALSRSCKSFHHSVSHDSAIGQHLLDNKLCPFQYNNDRFSLLSTGRLFFIVSP